MPRVDFYVLPSAEEQARWQWLCRLAEKAFTLGNSIYVHCGTAPEAQNLDDLLWTFRQNSFVPHRLFDGDAQNDDGSTPILIGWQQKPSRLQQLLINSSAEIPLFYQEFERVAEIVTQQPILLKQLRARYTQYRDAGHIPQVHRL